jgi:hypothetical protein
MRERLRDLAVLVLLCALVAPLAAWGHGRLDPVTWRVPVDYGGDALFVLAVLKAAGDGHVAPLRRLEVPELGAPFGARWDDFIRQHKPQLWLAGALVRRVGLFRAANLVVLAAHLLAAAAFLVVARRLGARRSWAAACAAAFGLSPFLFGRSLAHMTVIMCWPLPFCVLVVGWAFSRAGLGPASSRLPAAAGVAVLQGFHSVYFSGLFAQFLVLAAATQALRGRGWRRAAGPLVVLVVLLGTTALDNANTLAARWEDGPNPLLPQRGLGDLERYALRPVELALAPPGSGVLAQTGLGERYFYVQRFRSLEGGAYLGLAGLLGLGWLAVEYAASALEGRRRAVGPLAAVGWVLLYSVVGGLNTLMGVLGFIWLRATTRYAAWILVLALLALVVRLSRASAGWSRPRRAAAVLGLGVLVLADLVPRADPRPRDTAIREAIASDRRIVAQVEAALPARAMVFQLPVMTTPESPRIHRLRGYEPYRPYLFSSRLRFSYGADKGRPREAWQLELPVDDAPALVTALESRGFSGLLVDRRGYPDRGEALLAALEGALRPVRAESPDGQLVFVPLTPTPPRPPAKD